MIGLVVGRGGKRAEGAAASRESTLGGVSDVWLAVWEEGHEMKRLWARNISGD